MADHNPHISASELRRMTVRQMQELLNQLGVQYSKHAQRSVLLSKLECIYSVDDEELETRNSPSKETALKLSRPPTYQNQTIAQLKAEIERRGLRWTGKRLKADFIAILEKDDQTKRVAVKNEDSTDSMKATATKATATKVTATKATANATKVTATKATATKATATKATATSEKTTSTKTTATKATATKAIAKKAKKATKVTEVRQMIEHQDGSDIYTFPEHIYSSDLAKYDSNPAERHFEGEYYLGSAHEIFDLVRESAARSLDDSLKKKFGSISPIVKPKHYTLQPGSWNLYVFFDRTWGIWALHKDFIDEPLQYQNVLEIDNSAGYLSKSKIDDIATGLIEANDLSTVTDDDLDDDYIAETLSPQEGLFIGSSDVAVFYAAYHEDKLVGWAIVATTLVDPSYD